MFEAASWVQIPKESKPNFRFTLKRTKFSRYRDLTYQFSVGSNPTSLLDPCA
jgi:hypothetical protein